MRPRFFFDEETFGAGKLVINPIARGGSESEDAAVATRQLLKQFLAEAPFCRPERWERPFRLEPRSLAALVGQLRRLSLREI
jgi:hypothetical protein